MGGNSFLSHHYTKVKAVFSVSVLFVLAIGIYAGHGHRQLAEYISSLNNTDSIIEETRTIKRILSEIQLGARGYLISGESSFLKAYNDATDSTETHIRLLEKTTKNNSEQSLRVDKLKEALNRVIFVNSQMVALRSSGNISEAQKMLSELNLQKDISVINNLLQELEKEEQRSHNERLTELDHTIANQHNTLNIGFTTGVLFLLFALFFIVHTLKQKDRAEVELNRFFSSSPDLFCIVDLDGSFKRINPVFKDQLGYPIRDLMAMSFIELVHLEDRDATIAAMKQLKSSSKPTSFESRYLCSDGNYKWFSWIITLVPESSVFYGIGRDISENKKLEQENIAARKAALAASEAKSQFLANMSHEIRTPMNGVMGMTKLLLDTNLTSEQKDHVESIFVSSQNLLMIINDILDFSKVEAGKMSIEKTEFDLDNILNECERSLALTASHKGIEFEVEKLKMPYSVVGDSTRIRQVLLNLMSNAIKFTHQGGVKLKIKKSDELVSTVKIKFSIIDTGIGISEKALSKMFKAFSQADESTSRKFGGTGLGLSISKQLVELMDGQIGVESVEGEGSTFWFEIEFKKGREISALHSPHAPHLMKARYHGHILVVDDNQINQRVILRTLAKLGIKADLANNGKEALDKLAENPMYNLVLMDCHMPELDGYETTLRIRSNIKAAYNKIPIIALTANALSGEREKCLQLGMNEFLTKPLDDERLHEVLSRFLEKTEIEKASHAEILTAQANQAAASANANVKGVQIADQKSAAGSRATIDMTVLIKLEALQDTGEQDIVSELINSFLNLTPSRIKNMQNALDNREFAMCFDEAHTIKSDARTMGAVKLGDYCDRVEELRGTSDVDLIKRRVDLIIKEFEKVTESLNQIAKSRSKKSLAS